VIGLILLQSGAPLIYKMLKNKLCYCCPASSELSYFEH